MNPDAVIGIIGGMGPADGIDLADKLTHMTRAGADQEHLPVILISMPGQIPDRTSFLLTGHGENPGDSIADVALRLEAAGATVVGMPCNTAHAPRIMACVRRKLVEAGSSLHLIHMIDETVEEIRKACAPASRIGVLSTTGTRHSRIYQDPLGEAGFEVLELDETAHRRLVMDALYSVDHGIKVVGPPWSAARALLIEAIETLVSMGADGIVLGCTELPLAVPERRWQGIPLIDPAHILARAMIHSTYPDSLITDQS